MWHQGRCGRTVDYVFLLAYVDITARGRRSPVTEVTRALRRVRADAVVVAHCATGTANRLRRDARYDNVRTTTIVTADGSSLDTAVLGNGALETRPCDVNGVVLCSVRVGGGQASVASLGERPRELYQLLVRLGTHEPLIVVGALAEDLDAPATRTLLDDACYVDASGTGAGGGEAVRDVGIVVRGLRTYGDGIYETPEGLKVHWSRLGYGAL